jgi:hypothetical protein
MEIYTSKRRIDNSREPLIVAYGEDCDFRDLERIFLDNNLNSQLVILD